MFEAKAVATDSQKAEFIPVIPEAGLDAVQVGMLVDLGLHKQLPRFKKTATGSREKDEDGKDIILMPYEGEKGLDQKIAVYVDLLNQTHDYEGDIGVRNIRLPLHESRFGVSMGLNYKTVANRDANGQYIKGKPWLLAPASMWQKIAAVTTTEHGQSVKDVIFHADYKNPNLNNVGVLLGKPFNMEVKVTESVSKTDKSKKYTNVSLKSPVSLMKGQEKMLPKALIGTCSVSLKDKDLLEPKPELNGACKLDLLRKSDLHMIVLADNYQGSEIQKAIQSKFNEDELVAKAKENWAKMIAADRDLQEIYAMSNDSAAPPPPQKKEEAKVVQKPVESSGGFDDDIPFGRIGLQNKLSIHWM